MIFSERIWTFILATLATLQELFKILGAWAPVHMIDVFGCVRSGYYVPTLTNYTSNT